MRPSTVWNGSLLVGLLSAFAISLSSGNSIMDIINMEKVEKMIAERRENGTPEDHRFLLQNTIDAEETFLTADDEDDVGTADDDPLEHDQGLINKRNRHKFFSNNIHRYDKGRPHRNQRQNFTGMPDFASVLADLTSLKPDKILKSDNNPMLITKKEYLKKDWCKTEPMVQKIREEKCLTRTILNRFCYGQCNSFYIPKNPPRRKRNRKKLPGDDELEENLSFRSCGFCKPKKASWILVTLRCPSAVPRLKRKRVQRIKQCKCIAENVGP